MACKYMYSPGIQYYANKYKEFSLKERFEEAKNTLLNVNNNRKNDGQHNWNQRQGKVTPWDTDDILCFLEPSALNEGNDDLITLVSAAPADKASLEEMKKNPRCRFVHSKSGIQHFFPEES